MIRAAPLSPAARRAALMAVTEPLLVRHGATLNTRQIAAAAGVAEGTIFRVFPTKDALIDAIVDDAFTLDPVCAELAAIDLTADLESRLVAAAEVLHARFQRMCALFHTLMARGAHSQPLAEARSRHERERERVHDALAAVLEPDRVRLRRPPREAAQMLTALLMSAAHPLLAAAERPDPRQIVQILLYGVLAPVTTTPDRTPPC